MFVRPWLRRASSFQVQFRAGVVAKVDGFDGDVCGPSQVVDEMPLRNEEEVRFYRRLLFECSRAERNGEALDVFLGAVWAGVCLDELSFSCVLKVCGSLREQLVGRQVHCCVKSGIVEDVSVGTGVVDLFMANGNAEDRERVFGEMKERNVISWTSLLTGFANNGLNGKAVELFSRMQAEGTKPNPYTFSTVLGAVAANGDVRRGRAMHAVVVRNGLVSALFVRNSLISMY